MDTLRDKIAEMLFEYDIDATKSLEKDILKLFKQQMLDLLEGDIVNCSEYRSDSAKFKACRFYNEYLLQLRQEVENL